MIYKRKTKPALWTAMHPKIGTLQKPKPIRVVSKHRAARMVKYRKLAMAHLERHKHCQVCISQWYVNRNLQVRPATQIHHMKGRGLFLNDVSTWLAVCQECHRRIHDNVKWAMDNFLLQSRA